MAARSASIKRAVDNAVRASHLTPREEATAALAKRLAVEIDDCDDLDLLVKLSGRLLPVLEALGMTRTAAANATKGSAPADVPVSALDQLKAKREQLRAAPR